MKFSARILEYIRREDGELIARFGQAELVRHLGGRCELRGGTAADHARAREWCSLFFHESSIVWPEETAPAG